MKPRILSCLLILAVAVAGAGCELIGHSTTGHRTASVVDFLYAGRAGSVIEPRIPVLSLPLRVGIAFVPGGGGASDRGDLGDHGLPEEERTRLLEQVADQFRGKPFVGSIQVIPTLYLQSRGGFANLDQLRNLYQIDVMVLVSYDQVQFSDGTPFSLTYWTLVGAYVVPAERNATHTLLDAAVFDLPSRQMLFRAPGISRIKGLSTLVGVERSLREDSLQSFRQASTNLISGLNTELAHFQDQMKSRPETAQIVHRKGYTGGGALRWSDLAFAFGVVATGWAIRGRRP